MSTVVKTGLWSLAIALAVLLVLFGAYFLHGSLEQFPTDEQQGKVRIVSGLGFISFAVLEIIVIIALRRRSKASPGTVAAQLTVQGSTSPPSAEPRP